MVLRNYAVLQPRRPALQMRRRLSLENSVQNPPSSCFQSKNIKNRTYEMIILNTVLCGCGTRPLTIREENI
jgi:hypothetical protein